MDEAQYLSLSIEQRKAFQKQLQAKGLYVGPIDGKGGTGMQAAFGAIDKEKKGEAANALEREKIGLEKARLAREEQKEKEDKERRDKEAKDKQAREDASNPWTEQFIPFVAGAGTGGAYGELVNRRFDKDAKGRIDAVGEIAEEIGPTRKLTASQASIARARGAAKAAEQFAPPTAKGKAVSMAGRAASYGIPAAMLYNEYKNYQARADDKSLTDKERKANQQIANGLLGTFTGIGVEGGARFFWPSHGKGHGKAMARINIAREFADRMDEKAKTTPARATRAKAPAVAAPTEAAGLASTASKIPKLPGGAGPAAAAAGLAYALSPSDAEAGTGGPSGGQGQAAQNAAVAGGTAYGLNRIANAIPPIASKALGMGLGMSAPQLAMGMGPETQEEANSERSRVAVNHPWLARNVFGLTDEMGQQLPERNTGKTDEFATARSLQIPEGIPLPQPQGGNAAPDKTPWMLPFMSEQRRKHAKEQEFESTLAELESFMATPQ